MVITTCVLLGVSVLFSPVYMRPSPCGSMQLRCICVVILLCFLSMFSQRVPIRFGHACNYALLWCSASFVCVSFFLSPIFNERKQVSSQSRFLSGFFGCILISCLDDFICSRRSTLQIEFARLEQYTVCICMYVRQKKYSYIYVYIRSEKDL